MLKKEVIATLLLLNLIITSISVLSSENNQKLWDKEWSFNKEINIPIDTADENTKYQPIDLYIEFINPCWAKNENEHSVRVCSWDGYKWHELESQIYDLESKDPYHINRCGLVFLVPDIADGEERYFVYYDDNEKTSPNYFDHVNTEDAYYYYEPISGILIEADYYKIVEDGYCVYAIGQKGKIINRYFSQAIIKTKPETKKFDVSNSENAASFAFGYNIGPKEEDQIASDQILVSKEIHIDGNLMVEFGVVSESEGKELRTTNIYKYYYCPTENKRICVRVKHEVLKEGIVKGQENVDGTYGGILSYRSRSSFIKRIGRRSIVDYAVGVIGGADLQRREVIEDIEPGDGGQGEAVDIRSVAGDHGVEPPAPSGATRGGAVLVCLLPDKVSALIVELRGHRAASHPGGVRLEYPEDPFEAYRAHAQPQGYPAFHR